jgi:hypothetical protein
MEFEWVASKEADNLRNPGGYTLREPSICDVKVDTMHAHPARVEKPLARVQKILTA